MLVTVDDGGPELARTRGRGQTLLQVLPPAADWFSGDGCGPEIMMRFVTRELETQGLSREDIYLSIERNMKCAVGFCGHCQYGPHFICKDGPVFRYEQIDRYWRNMSSKGRHKPRIGVFKFASCDGCQLSLLDAEDELLEVAGAVEIAYFPEASRAMSKGPYDIGLVEGSITTYLDAQRIQEVRRQCKTLITIGACATAGGIQALRNWRDVDEFIRVVYSTPQLISTLKLSTPIAEHVPVDFELRGCPD